jgi:hypothetical protein
MVVLVYYQLVQRMKSPLGALLHQIFTYPPLGGAVGKMSSTRQPARADKSKMSFIRPDMRRV